MNKLISVRELAEVVGLSENTIYSLTASGDLPHLRFGAAIRFDPVDVEAWARDEARRKAAV